MNPLPPTARYAKTEHGGVSGDKPISGLQGLVEASRRPAMRSVLSESLRSGRGFVLSRRSRSRMRRWRVLAKRSGANRPRRRGWHVIDAELKILIAARNQRERRKHCVEVGRYRVFISLEGIGCGQKKTARGFLHGRPHETQVVYVTLGKLKRHNARECGSEARRRVEWDFAVE